MPPFDAQCTARRTVTDSRRPDCASVEAHACRSHTAWIQHCCASIAMQDPMIDDADRVDLAETLWDRPSCRSACPRLSAELLFSDQLTRLL